MALPPRPMGTLVDSGSMQGGPEDDLIPGIDIPVEEPETFEGGASVTEGEDGSAIVEALSAALEEAAATMDVAHDANLAEYLDDGYLGELSSELRTSYEDD